MDYSDKCKTNGFNLIKARVNISHANISNLICTIKTYWMELI
jgi:hypothetical protein